MNLLYKKHVSKFKVFFFYVLCFTLGLSAFFSISDDSSTQRDPASINGKLFQISSLSSEQIKNQLTKNFKIQPTLSGQKTVRLEGFSSVLCKTYETIELKFIADGIAVGGETPEMTIKTPCEAGQDPAEMASVLIPIDRILSEKPRNAEFHFDGYASKFEFANSPDSWPRTWILKTVSFKSQNGKNKIVHLDKNDHGQTFAKASQQMIVLEF